MKLRLTVKDDNVIIQANEKTIILTCRDISEDFKKEQVIDYWVKQIPRLIEKSTIMNEFTVIKQGKDDDGNFLEINNFDIVKFENLVKGG